MIEAIERRHDLALLATLHSVPVRDHHVMNTDKSNLTSFSQKGWAPSVFIGVHRRLKSFFCLQGCQEEQNRR
jgi:hypothetical protein